MDDYENFARAQLPRLLRYATMLTGEREQAADLVQDVLVKVYRRWSRISDTDHPDELGTCDTLPPIIVSTTSKPRGNPGEPVQGHQTRYAPPDPPSPPSKSRLHRLHQ